MPALGDGVSSDYKADSITLTGAVSMGTGVMIGAGIFALTGQIAELAGPWFPLAFLAAAVVTGFSAYSYVKMSNAYPSAGGIAMYLHKAYGPGVMTGASALLMALSMVINESLVARTFGTYTLQLFGIGDSSWLVPVLAVGLIIFAFLVNISGNRLLDRFALFMALLKVGGITAFAIAALYVSGFQFEAASSSAGASGSVTGFIAAMALGILAYKGFTTITNDGAELVNPRKNVGRAIIISILICLVIYLLVTWGVGANLTVSQIVSAKNYSLAQAARPAMGEYGLWFTVAIAIIATASGLVASTFAVSRMLAMLTDMQLIPHRHFGMPGRIQTHTLVYTVVVAGALAVLFDLSRIASLGAVFYLVMDMAIHWGVLRHLREEVSAKSWILLTAIGLDAIVLAAFLIMKAQSDPLIVAASIGGLLAVFLYEAWYLKSVRSTASARNEN